MGKRSKKNAAGDAYTKPEDAPEVDTVAAPEKEEEAEDAAGSITVKYRDHVGQVASRTFSKDVHGKDFKKLAAEFKATNASKLVKDEDVA